MILLLRFHTLSDPIPEGTTETQNTQEQTARGLKHTRGDEAEWTPRGTQLDRATVRDCQNKTGNVTLTQTQRTMDKKVKTRGGN